MVVRLQVGVGCQTSATAVSCGDAGAAMECKRVAGLITEFATHSGIAGVYNIGSLVHHH